eukprot:3941590-Rhodomonas_salina.1
MRLQVLTVADIPSLAVLGSWYCPSPSPLYATQYAYTDLYLLLSYALAIRPVRYARTDLAYRTALRAVRYAARLTSRMLPCQASVSPSSLLPLLSRPRRCSPLPRP